MKKDRNDRPAKIEPTIQEQIESTIDQLKNCPRFIKEEDLKGFMKQKENCENFLNNGVSNGILQMKAQMRMMSVSEYCTAHVEYLNGVISYLESDLAKDPHTSEDE